MNKKIKSKPPKNKRKSITGWTIKVWWDNGKTQCIDTSDMYDDVCQGIDDYLTEYEKHENGENTQLTEVNGDLHKDR
jgi:chemotaxis regulatin CheY-phosphate phosphatase CheZ